MRPGIFDCGRPNFPKMTPRLKVEGGVIGTPRGPRIKDSHPLREIPSPSTSLGVVWVEGPLTIGLPTNRFTDKIKVHAVS